jgi:predicted transcriptional regulator
MLELFLQGYTVKQVSEELNVSPQMVSIVLKSPRFQDQLARRREKRDNENREIEKIEVIKAKEIIQESSQRAAEVQRDLLESPDESIRFKASGSILDKVFPKEGKDGGNKGGGGGTVIQIEADKVAVIQSALKEISE